MNLIRFINIFFIFVIIVLVPFGFISYSGSKVYYVIFSLISSYALLISFNKNSISFDTFFSLLIWLGLWFKFTVQISFINSMFPEGSGIFDYKSNSYDQVLIISSVSILGFIFARFVRIKFIFDYINLSSITYNNDHYANFYSNYRKNIFYIYFFSIIFFALINYIFVFFQKGTIPEVILPFGLNNFINWLLMFGLTTFSSLIVFFEFHYKKKNSNKIVKYGLLETFISSISILSRAMIFNATALIYGFYRLIEINKVKIKINSFIKYFLVVLVLFMICLLIVSKIRQSKDFPVGHEVHKYIPQIVTKGSDDEPVVIELTNDFSKEINQIIFLISGRWVGIEGIMAVYSNKDINYESFLNSFNDSFDYSNSFYENTVKKSKHIYKENPKIFTVYTPGIIAFLFYTKSLIFLFCGIFLICIFCSIIEYFSYRLSRGNIVFSYIIGNVLAYRLAHFGYMPQNTYKLLFAIIFNLLLVFAILKFIKIFWKK